MDPANDDHHQAELDDVFASGADDDETAQSQPDGAQQLVDQYLTSKRTSGSQAYAASADSVLHRWAAWLGNHDYNDLSTTQAAYQHIDAEERREQLDEYLDSQTGH